MTLGKVYLVGAGPGDPGLITVRGLRLIQSADVIAYDRLIPRALLDEARAEAELIDVGKAPTKQRTSQDDINTLIVEKAQQGKQVVRLKGGDPFVFGRGGEEALACYAAGIPFEIVPGVSSSVAAPAYAGVPVTYRNLVSAFTVFTGHEDPTKPETAIDYAALAGAAKLGTLVLLMGVSHLADVTSRLITAGVAADTPALCVEWGTTERQRVVEATVQSIAARVAEAGLASPSTTVIGQVVTLRAQGLNWFG